MEIRNLSAVPLSELTQVFNQAFEGYFVPLQLTEEAMATKIRSENINLNYSVGVFDHNQLKGFILHGLQMQSGRKMVYNGGTGVVPEFRGNQWTEQMYGAVIPLLKQDGIYEHQLEVIEQNTKALRIYEKIGFNTVRTLSCFKGRLERILEPEVSIREVPIPRFEVYTGFWNFSPTWQNDTPAILRALDSHKVIEMNKDEELIGYAIYAPSNGRVKQFAIHPAYRCRGYGRALFGYLCNVPEKREVNLINIDERDASSMAFFKAIGFQRFLGLLEMKYYAHN